jgi:hypothetical protein
LEYENIPPSDFTYELVNFYMSVSSTLACMACALAL